MVVISGYSKDPTGGGYVASAVHFDGSTYLEFASLIATDERYVAYSFWQKVSQDALDQGYQIMGPQSLPSPQQFTNAFVGINLNSNGDDTRSNVNFNNSATTGQEVDTLTGTNVPDVWQNVRVDYDAQTKIIHIFYGASDATDTGNFSSYPGSPSSPFPLSGLNVGIPDTVADGFPLVGDLADFCFFSSSSPIDMSLGGSGSLFYSGGKPVDPSGFPSSLILFTGDASSFATNLGTGGIPTVTGTLTNATTSPSD